MKNRFSILLVALCLGSLLGGCGPGGGENRPTNSTPSEGTLGLSKLTPEEQIAKVQNDKTIPEEYKQTYINSIKAKTAAGGAPK